MQQKNNTFYDILEISEKASPEIIKAAYITMIKKYHPDNYNGDANYAKEMVQRLNEIYQVLSDPLERKKYDEFIALSKIKKAPNTTAPKKPQKSLKKEMAFVLIPLIIYMVLMANLIFKPKIEPPPSVSETIAPIALPSNGTVYKNRDSDYTAPLKINTSGNDNYYIKLKDYKTKTDQVIFFVRGGKDFEIEIPVGKYLLYYACGEHWYGLDQLFGKNTLFYKADDIFTFSISKGYANGYELTLYPVIDGNLDTEIINPDDF